MSNLVKAVNPAELLAQIARDPEALEAHLDTPAVLVSDASPTGHIAVTMRRVVGEWLRALRSEFRTEIRAMRAANAEARAAQSQATIAASAKPAK
jgi:hypothetical protein